MTNENSTTPESVSPQGPPPVPGSVPPMRLTPMEKEPGFLSTFETILRRPGSIVHHLTDESPGRLIALLLACSAACLLVFGFVVGTFSMEESIQTLNRTEEKKISGVGSILIALGGIYDLSDSLSLLLEADFTPYSGGDNYEGGVDFGALLRIMYSF